jgi:sialic acid synthase SpsE
MIDEASDAGADAVKFQSFKAEMADYQKKSLLD